MKRFVFLFTTLLAMPVYAGDTRIGQATEKNGMHIEAVYIQPVLMEPEHGIKAGEADIHLEADVAALKSNPHGFPEGGWIPYMDISYRIEQAGKGWATQGHLMPMAASDGPHYGDNVALNGPGKYTLTFTFSPPSMNGFMRHIDKETSVAPWWEKFDLHYEFTWIGSTGKKGGY